MLVEDHGCFPLAHHCEESLGKVGQPFPQKLCLVERAVVRQDQIESQQNGQRRVAMELTDVCHQLVDGRSGQTEIASSDHDQTVFHPTAMFACELSRGWFSRGRFRAPHDLQARGKRGEHTDRSMTRVRCWGHHATPSDYGAWSIGCSASLHQFVCRTRDAGTRDALITDSAGPTMRPRGSRRPSARQRAALRTARHRISRPPAGLSPRGRRHRGEPS
jgi:hypothetical protein